MIPGCDVQVAQHKVFDRQAEQINADFILVRQNAAADPEVERELRTNVVLADRKLIVE